MGDRAVITNKDKKFGIYLHWNGGRTSVQGFLEYCRRAGYRDLTSDPAYGFARLAQVISNYFGAGGTSVGIGPYECLDTDNGDNGVYIVDGWEIVGRECFDCEEDEPSPDSVEKFIRELEQAQPYPLPGNSRG